MEIVQAVKKLNSISREQLNFRRRPILCTTLYTEKPYTREQLRWHIWPIFSTFPLNLFMKFSHKMPLYFFYTRVQKSQTDFSGLRPVITFLYLFLFPSLLRLKKLLTFCLRTNQAQRKLNAHLVWHSQRCKGRTKISPACFARSARTHIGAPQRSRRCCAIQQNMACVV